MTRPPTASWSPPRGSRRGRLASLVAGTRTPGRPRAAARQLGIGLLAVGALATVNPNTTHLPLCPLHAMTGLWCPLCGSTRAGYALLHGQLGTAVADNALFVAALPVLALLWIRRARQGGRGRLLPGWWYWPALAFGLAFGVLRNLPAGSWLAPPG